MDTVHHNTIPSPLINPTAPNSVERAMKDAQLFRSLATPFYLTTPARKRQASVVIAEAKAKGLMDSFEGMDEWFKTEPVKKSKNTSVKNTVNVRVNEKEVMTKESPDTIQIKIIIERAKKMILNRPPVDGTLPPFVPFSGNAQSIKQSPLVKEIEIIPQNDSAAWQGLLNRLVEQKANPLVIIWISEHIIHLSMTPTQQAFRQTAREQWRRLGSKQFNPIYASREDLITLLTRK